MNRVVLDASVLLAIAREERYERSVLDLLPDAVMSAVNLAEILTKVVETGPNQVAEVEQLLGQLAAIVPFTVKHASLAAQLRASTRHAGLSLGDRACLALALDLGAPAYTTDRSWLRVVVGCPVYCLR